MTTRTKPIIAVFGGDDPRMFTLAQLLGREIATAKAILLTGGSADPAQIHSVKEQAIVGACPLRSAGTSAPWIGVERVRNAVGNRLMDGGAGFVIDTNLGHSRNCLEASLCDAAIALEGGDGTASEAAFTLSLGKPVAFLGAVWNGYGVSAPPAAPVWKTMVNAGFRRVGTIPGSAAPLNAVFAPAQVLARLTSAATWQWWPTPASASQLTTVASIVKWLVGTATLSGDFPPISTHTQVISAYNQWLPTV